VRPARVVEALDRGAVVLVAGFQGVSTDAEVTTLGRGGSDTTAVALALALGAYACVICTDVEGVLTADPRVVPTASRLPSVSFDEMLELAASGARVLQLRSVEFARSHRVPLHVRSSFTDGGGTWVVEEDEGMLEKETVSGIAHTLDETVYRVEGTTTAELFTALAAAQVNVDTIMQTGPEILFSAPSDDHATTVTALEATGAAWSADEGLGKVSIVGAGMKSHPGIAATVFSALEDIGARPAIVSTSPIKIACFLPHADVERAVRALHDAFELDATGEDANV
jgi:aspartate kinase